MRENWEIKKLAQVSGFQNGFAFKSKTFKEEGIPVIRITNIQDQSIDFSKVVYVNPKDYDKDLTKYHIVKGDLLIAMSGATTGKIGINNSDNIALLNQRVGKFEPNEDLLKLFLYYFLSTKVEESLAISAGSAQPNLSTEQIKSFEIPIPPIEEQKEIVEILDQAFESIEKAKANIEKNIENAKELFQSKLNQMFSQVKEGWVSVSLKNIGIIQTGSTPSTKDKSNYGNHIPFVKPPHFNKNGTLNTGESMLSESGLKKSRLIKANSVLMVCIGATIGKTAFTEQDICTNQQINALTSNDNYIPKLLYYGMISPTFQNKVKSEGRSSQATLPIINKSKWSNLEIILPQNISKQKEIVETLDIMYNHIQSLLPSYEEELKNLEELKKSILRKAFSGELTNKNKAA